MAKTSRASEEVVIHKEAKDRVETVRDRLRETKVDVEQPSRDAPTTRMDEVEVTDDAEITGAQHKP